MCRRNSIPSPFTSYTIINPKSKNSEKSEQNGVLQKRYISFLPYFPIVQKLTEFSQKCTIATNLVLPKIDSMSTPLINLNANKIEQLPLTLNECLRKSRKRNEYHIFILLFRIHLLKLKSKQQSSLLAASGGRISKNNHHHHQQHEDDNSSLSSIVSSLSSCDSIIRPKEILVFARKRWNRLKQSEKEARKRRATLLKSRPNSNITYEDFPSPLHEEYSSNRLKECALKSLSQEWIGTVAFFRNAILRKPRSSNNIYTKVYTFGNEKFLLNSQLYRTLTLTHLLQVVLFGYSFSEVKNGKELV